MMRAIFKIQFILILTALSFAGYTQKGKISGKIFSSESSKEIAQANIQLLDKNSKTLFTKLSDSTGNFSFNNISSGTYILKVDAISYSSAVQTVYLLKNNFFFDSIFLKPSYSDLQSVIVTAKKPAVVIKPDTTEFNASSFKTGKNATIEDVFKKMPGFEVSNGGVIKAQGEIVTQIYVDGKPFFGNDLKAVTQNFPAEMIDKIQIIDKKSDEASETKSDDGSYDRIINITLKKSNKKGIFGKNYVGYGTSKRVEAKANENFFNNDKKLSVITGINNTGRYDGSSYNNSFSSLENKQLKINYANKIKNNFDFSAWAAYDENKNTVEQLLNRQNIFFDSSTYYVAKNKNNSVLKNIYGGLYFEYKPDSVSVLRFNESASYINNSYGYVSQFNTTTFNEYKINEGINENNGLSKTPSVKGQISYNRRLSNSGRNLFIGFSDLLNSNVLTLNNNFNNYFYPIDATSYACQLKQLQNSNNGNTNIGTTVSYSEPLTLHQTLNFSYVYNADNNNMPKEVFDFNEQNDLYNLNDSLTYHFINSTTSNTFSVNYNYTSAKIGFGGGLRWKQSVTENRSSGKEDLYQQTFRGFLPNLSFYAAGKGKRLNVYYSSFIQAPQPYQLQPVIDNTNPLYLSFGNAALKYAEVHMLKYNFKYYNSKKERGFNSSANFSIISNNIGTSVSYDNSTGKQITQPVNTDGAFNWNMWLSYFEPLHICNDKIKWNINFSNGGFKSNNLLNGERNILTNNFDRIFIGLTYDSHDWLNAHTDISLTKQTNKYSLQPSLDNSSYFVSISPVVTLRAGKNTEINIDDDYRLTTVKATNFNSCVHMLNVNITRYFNSEKNIWLMLKGYNLFDETASMWQMYGDNFIQSIQTNTLPRYFLLTVNFRLNKFQQ